MLGYVNHQVVSCMTKKTGCGKYIHKNYFLVFILQCLKLEWAYIDHVAVHMCFLLIFFVCTTLFDIITCS